MKSRFGMSLRTLGILAMASLLSIALVSSVLAGTGVGGNVQLGMNNTISGAATIVTAVMSNATTTVNALEIRNDATTGLGRAIYLLSRTTAPTAMIQNTLGPGVQISVPAGKAPIIASAGSATAPNLSADSLDLLDSTAFLRSTGKAVDADKIDGVDSASIWQGRQYVLSRATNGSANVNGTCPSGALCYAAGFYCDHGDVMTGGGFSDIDSGTRLVTSEPFYPNPQDTWRVVFVNNSTEDLITVHTICADFGTPHP
jgi:hypothetical protein